LLIIVLLVCFLSFSVGQEETEPLGWAQFRFVNLVTGSGSSSVSFDLYASYVPFLKSVYYRTVSSYTKLPARTFDFLVTPAGSSNQVAQKRVELVNNQTYTLMLSGSYDDLIRFPLKLSFVQDNNTLPNSYQLNLRVINMAPGLPPLRISYATSSYSSYWTTLIPSVSFGNVISYQTIPSGSYVKAFLASSYNLTVFSPISVGYSSYRTVATLWITGQFEVSYSSMYFSYSTDSSSYYSENDVQQKEQEKEKEHKTDKWDQLKRLQEQLNNLKTQ